MKSEIIGRVWKFGDDINTDIISPAEYMDASYEVMGKHAMERAFSGFADAIAEGDIIVAGKNFGSGSSRETAQIALKYAGVGAVIAKDFARMENITMIYQAEGRIPQRIGNRYESTYPYDVFPAMDGDVVIAAGNNKLYGILCDVMGKPELKEDPRFLNVKDRVAHHEEMREIVVAWTEQHTISEVDKLLNDAGCPACPVNTIDRMVKDPQIADARGMFPEIDQPGIGRIHVTATAQKLTRTKSCPRKAAPLLGEDNAAVYGEFLNYDENKLAELKKIGAI